MLQKIIIGTLVLLYFQVGQVRAQGNAVVTPFIKNYTSFEYKYHPKNFAIVQDMRGVMYFGNAYGVLEFDGVSWSSIKLPDGKSAISFVEDSAGKIFIGSVGELGYLTIDSVGRTSYQTLMSGIPKTKREFGEVWRSYSNGDEIVFCSYAQISIYHKDKFSFLTPSKEKGVFDFSSEVNGRLYVREAGVGLSVIEQGTLTVVDRGEYFADIAIYGMQPFGDNKILIFSDLGLKLYDGEKIEAFENSARPFIAGDVLTDNISLSDKHSALAFSNNGILIYANDDRLVYRLTKANGLPSDNILDLYVDRENNLWVATDNGISHVQISSPFASIGEQAGLQGMGYTACIYEGKLYLGTSKGVFVRDWNGNEGKKNSTFEFKLVTNTEGQVWTVSVEGGKLLCGHARGLFQITNNIAERISADAYTGGWTLRSVPGKPYLMAGTYNGLEIYEQHNGNWKFRNTIQNFQESARQIEIDDSGNIWVCHGNKGLFKIALDKDLRTAVEVINVSAQQGFAPDYFNDIAWIDDTLIFSGEHHVYRANEFSGQLERDEYLNKFIDGIGVIGRIRQQENGDIWIVNDDGIEVLEKQQSDAFVKNKARFSKLKGQLIGSYEFFKQYNNLKYFIGTQNGFVHYDASVKISNGPFNTVIRKVESIDHGDSTLFWGSFSDRNHCADTVQSLMQQLEIPFEYNALRFSYAALFYEDHEKTQFQYFLEQEGVEESNHWSDWAYVTYKEYTNLWEGNYAFHVRGRNVHGVISNECVYRFSIVPPWYRSTVAYFVYVLLSIGFVAVVIKFVRAKISREKQRVEREKAGQLLLIEKQFAEEALKAEREIILLQNEKLEADVRYKNTELVYLATNLSQKSEFITQLKKDLVTISRDDEHESKVTLTEVIKAIEKGNEFDDSWDHFQANFDIVHQNFLFKVRERFPFLKSTDLLLCAYIRINKSNKEISSLLNISVSAVEKRRFRLREKLKLDNDTRLTEFLMEV